MKEQIEKQAIEEMARYMAEISHIECGRKSCEECKWNGVERIEEADCTDYLIAEALYNAGYRKQSEGEWRSELIKRCDWKGKKHDYYQPNSCSLCHEAVLKRTPFRPNCGAKMKGGAE